MDIESDGAASSAPGTLMLFWDYDTQWGADRSRLPGGQKAWGPLEFSNTERLLELHARYAVPACFAVVGAAALPGERPYHDPQQIRQIHAAGHEVASHAFRHEWLPGLTRREVSETLRASREALEHCIGASVTAFVPPFNQPFDHPAALSISLSERRSGSPERMSLGDVCEALTETGYRFCRVAYRPLWQRLAEKIAGQRLDRPGRLERIRGQLCARLNTPGGFSEESEHLVDRCASRGGIAVVYGHPHSISAAGAQNEAHLVRFLEKVRALRGAGRIRTALPREMIQSEAAA